MQLLFYLRILRHGWWIIAITVLSALIVAFAFAYQTTPVYRTSARFIVSPNTDQASGSRDLVNSLTALDKRTIASTFAEILNSDRLYKEASAELGIDPNLLRRYQISTVVLPDSNILELSVTGSDPSLIAALANTVGQRGVEYVATLYQVYTVDLLDPALPPSEPISPNPRRDASLAVVLGLMLGTALVFGREYFLTPLLALRHQTNTDGVSAAYTRGYVLSRLDELVQQRSPQLSLGLIQLDGLQEAITTTPAPTLQPLLQRITAIIRDELRGNDVVGRWNDTGFVVLLPVTSGPAAMEKINRICQVLSKPIDLTTGDAPIALNPRAGLIEHRGNESVSLLVERAEIALEQTRQNGTRATLFSPDMQIASA